MKNIYFSIISVFIVCLFAVLMGCKHSLDPRLIEAEHLMESHPDSALLILETIRNNELSEDYEVALYGLLKTQAMDKCYLSPTNDSLIIISEKFFNEREATDILNTIKANYYSGRVYYNKGENAMAIVYYVKAKQMALKTGHDFWVGLACRGISDIYCDTYNTTEELLYAKEEYEYFKRCGTQPYLNYAFLDFARALFNSKDTESSSQICNQLLDSALMTKDVNLHTSALRQLAINQIMENKYDEAHNSILTIFESGIPDAIDSIHLCEILFWSGKTNDADSLINLISGGSESLKANLRYEMAKSSRSCEEALYYLEKVDSLTNSSFENSVSHNLLSSLANHFDMRKQIDDMRISNANTRTTIIVVVSLMLFILGCISFIRIFKIQNKKITDKIEYAERIREELERNNIEKNEISETIRSLLAEKYKLLDDLCYIVYTNNDSKTARRKVADAVTKLISDLSVRSDVLIDLENKVDCLYGNIFSDFKVDLPNLKEADYRLFLFSVVGIANASISLLLNEQKINSVYERKRRIKEKIKMLDKEKQDRYFKYMH